MIVYIVPLSFVFIVALILLGVLGIAVGTVAEWIFAHITIITIVLWALLVVLVLICAKRGNKIYYLSTLALFVAPYMLEILWIDNLIWQYHKGIVGFVLYCFLGGIYIIPLLPLLPSCLVAWLGSVIRGEETHSAARTGIAIFLNVIASVGYILVSGPIGEVLFPQLAYEVNWLL